MSTGAGDLCTRSVGLDVLRGRHLPLQGGRRVVLIIFGCGMDSSRSASISGSRQVSISSACFVVLMSQNGGAGVLWMAQLRAERQEPPMAGTLRTAPEVVAGHE
jgi:hypothetical protein